MSGSRDRQAVSDLWRLNNAGIDIVGGTAFLLLAKFANSRSLALLGNIKVELNGIDAALRAVSQPAMEQLTAIAVKQGEIAQTFQTVDTLNDCAVACLAFSVMGTIFAGWNAVNWMEGRLFR